MKAMLKHVARSGKSLRRVYRQTLRKVRPVPAGLFIRASLAWARPRLLLNLAEHQ